jgi:hypothetical protein
MLTGDTEPDNNPLNLIQQHGHDGINKLARALLHLWHHFTLDSYYPLF